MRAVLLLPSFLFLIILYSCEDKITTSCETENIADDTLQPKLSVVQEAVFDVYCVSCHNTSAPQGGLDLSPSNAYDNLVNAASSSSSKKRVIPGDSENSYLLERITGSGGETIMPPSGKMDQVLIDLVQQWIDEGAQNN